MPAPPRINCEAFHVRVGEDDISVIRGLAIARAGEARFINAQHERTSRVPVGLVSPKNLGLELSSAHSPEVTENHQMVVNKLSLNRAILEGVRHCADLRRFRAQKPAANPVGRMALVGIVNHDHDPTSVAYALARKGSVNLQHFRVSDETGRGAAVALALVGLGESLFIYHDTSKFAPVVERLQLTYNPDTIQGLTAVNLDPAGAGWQRAPTLPSALPPPDDSPSPPDFGGVREPQGPLPQSPATEAMRV
jgi:hypothetical protein